MGKSTWIMWIWHHTHVKTRCVPLLIMKHSYLSRCRHFAWIALVVLLLTRVSSARAGVNIHLELDYNSGGNSSYYLLFPILSTNSLTATPTNTGYFAWASSSASNSGSYANFLPDGTAPYSSAFYSDYPSFISALTNLWTLVVTNSTSTNTYRFKFSNLVSNAFPKVSMIFPLEGAVGVPNFPNFAWSGPSSNYSLFVAESGANSFYQSASLPVTQTNWASPVTLSNGSDYTISVSYSRDGSSNVVSTAPTNAAGTSLTGWSSDVSMNTYSSANFTVTNNFNSALNNSNLQFQTGGDAPWYYQTSNTLDGAAAQSGVIDDSQQSWIQTTVTGPGNLSFWWKVSSEADADYLEYLVDGSLTDYITGTSGGWAQSTYSIPAGSHTLQWLYIKDSALSDGYDAGWLDQVSFTSAAAAPIFKGTWTATGAMTNAIYFNSANLLADGKVVSAGGSDNTGAATASVQIYDPSTGTWKGTNPLSKARFAHTGTVLPNGKVLIAGGLTNYATSGLVQTVELFNPATSTWTNTGAMNYPRYGHTATLLPNGKVLVSGGLGKVGTNVNFATTDITELYDPATGLWTTSGTLNKGRYNHTATLLQDGKVLVAGGSITNATLVTQTAELYDYTTGLWNTTGSLPLPLGYHTATLLPNGHVLVAGGDSDIGGIGGISLYAVKNAQLFDPNSETWTATGMLNGVHDNHTATLLNNGLVLVAGTSVQSVTTNSAELYIPSTGLWTNAAQMKFPRNQFIATLLNTGEVLAVGGSGNSGFVATSELFSAYVKPVLTNLTRLAGAIQFQWTNLPGSTNIVLSSTNAATALTNWTVLGSATEISAGQFQFNDNQPATNSRKFYRVRSP